MCFYLSEKTMFQFHKVQLKARRVQVNATRTTQFQFHKVQLKVSPGRRAGLRIRRFNSIRYN